ncbi:MAG TPA: aldehyde dehydrogenase family protein, partial [Alphaproteobacteria bacterium]
MSRNDLKFYIGGEWVDPAAAKTWDVVNPATEEVAGQVSLGSKADVDRAVAAARQAFETYSQTTPQERMALLQRIIEVYETRIGEFAQAMTAEMGSPASFSKDVQAIAAVSHFKEMINVLKAYEFETWQGSTLLRREPIGVCGLITPWNWPLNQVTSKLASALAAGCTVVLKPSEFSPLSTIILAEVLHEAGVPKGVFNLVNGDGPTVGQALATHPDIDMMSFTGSTRAGILVAKSAADTVKRVHQELGGKSANILFPDVDLATAVSKGVAGCFGNSGQSCNAPTRMFVPRDRHDEAAAHAKAAAEKFTVGPADAANTKLGPVVSQIQFDKIQDLIQAGIDEGATLVAGGPGRPAELNRGYYIRPTVFADVTHDMRIAREEVFGPVLAILPYDTVEQAVEQANDTVYG